MSPGLLPCEGCPLKKFFSIFFCIVLLTSLFPSIILVIQTMWWSECPSCSTIPLSCLFPVLFVSSKSTLDSCSPLTVHPQRIGPVVIAWCCPPIGAGLGGMPYGCHPLLLSWKLAWAPLPGSSVSTICICAPCVPPSALSSCCLPQLGLLAARFCILLCPGPV